MARVAFRLRDPSNNYIYNMEINPLESNSPGVQANLNYMKPTASFSGPIIAQGLDEVQKLEFSGTILAENQFNNMLLFSALDYPWEVRDDLGRQWEVMCESFQPKRVKSLTYPWRHEYSWTLIVVRVL